MLCKNWKIETNFRDTCETRNQSNFSYQFLILMYNKVSKKRAMYKKILTENITLKID